MNLKEFKTLLEIKEKGSLYFAGDKSQFDNLVHLGYVNIIGNRITTTEKSDRLFLAIERFLEIYH